jgi:hypothetical protein
MQAETLNRAMNLYTEQDLIERIAQCRKILTYANGELAWDVSFELAEYEEILRAKRSQNEERSDLHFHSIGY